MEMAKDDKGIETDGAKTIGGENSHRDSAVPSSASDESESLGESQGSELGINNQDSVESSADSSSKNPKDNSSKVPEVAFKNDKTAADLPTAAINKALDSDDVVSGGKEGNANEAVVLDIPYPTDAETATEKPDSATKEGAIVGRCNDGVDVEDSVETSF